MSDALSRARLYERAGADALLIHSKSKDPGEVVEFLTAFRSSGSQLPVAIVPTTYPQLSATDAGRAGANVVIYANQGLRTAVTATRDVLRSVLRDGDTLAVEPQVASVASVLELIGTSALAARERRSADLQRAYAPAGAAAVD